MHGLALISGASHGLAVHRIGVPVKIEGQFLRILRQEFDTVSFRVLQQSDGVSVFRRRDCFRQRLILHLSYGCDDVCIILQRISSFFVLRQEETVCHIFCSCGVRKGSAGNTEFLFRGVLQCVFDIKFAVEFSVLDGQSGLVALRNSTPYIILNVSDNLAGGVHGDPCAVRIVRCHADVEGILSFCRLDARAAQYLDIAVVAAQCVTAFVVHGRIHIEVLQSQVRVVLDSHLSAGNLQRSVLQDDGRTFFKVHGLALIAGASHSLTVHRVGVAVEVEGQLLRILRHKLDAVSFRVFQQSDGVSVFCRGDCLRQSRILLTFNLGNGRSALTALSGRRIVRKSKSRHVCKEHCQRKKQSKRFAFDFHLFPPINSDKPDYQLTRKK